MKIFESPVEVCLDWEVSPKFLENLIDSRISLLKKMLKQETGDLKTDQFCRVNQSFCDQCSKDFYNGAKCTSFKAGKSALENVGAVFKHPLFEVNWKDVPKLWQSTKKELFKETLSDLVIYHQKMKSALHKGMPKFYLNVYKKLARMEGKPINGTKLNTKTLTLE